MKKKSLYMYAVLYHCEDCGTKIIVEPNFTLATSNDEVKMVATREIEEFDALNNLDRVEVIVRPF